MPLRPTNDAGNGASPKPDGPHCMAFTSFPAGHDTGMGNRAPGPGFGKPKPCATAPKSSLFSATLEAEPIKTPYCTPRVCREELPEARSALTAAACGPVNCTGRGPPGVGSVTVCMPKLLMPMLEKPVSSRWVYS